MQPLTQPNLAVRHGDHIYLAVACTRRQSLVTKEERDASCSCDHNVRTCVPSPMTCGYRWLLGNKWREERTHCFFLAAAMVHAAQACDYVRTVPFLPETCPPSLLGEGNLCLPNGQRDPPNDFLEAYAQVAFLPTFVEPQAYAAVLASSHYIKYKRAKYILGS